MQIREPVWGLLESLRERAAPDGWWFGDGQAPGAEWMRLKERGLVELSEPAPGRDRGWAVRLTSDGADALAFRAWRAEAAGQGSRRWLAKRADPAYREVGLMPSEMLIVRAYAAADQLCGQGVDLGDAVLEAVLDESQHRWVLQVTDAETMEIARAFYLEGLAGSVVARNRFSREYGFTYRPAGETPTSRIAARPRILL
jgi:hypothetical protein